MWHWACEYVTPLHEKCHTSHKLSRHHGSNQTKIHHPLTPHFPLSHFRWVHTHLCEAPHAEALHEVRHAGLVALHAGHDVGPLIRVQGEPAGQGGTGLKANLRGKGGWAGERPSGQKEKCPSPPHARRRASKVGESLKKLQQSAAGQPSAAIPAPATASSRAPCQASAAIPDPAIYSPILCLLPGQCSSPVPPQLAGDVGQHGIAIGVPFAHIIQGGAGALGPAACMHATLRIRKSPQCGYFR